MQRFSLKAELTTLIFMAIIALAGISLAITLLVGKAALWIGCGTDLLYQKASRIRRLRRG